jgi:hypothetical protein
LFFTIRTISKLRRIIGPKRKAVNRRVEKLTYEEVHDFYASSNNIRRIRTMEMGEANNFQTILNWKHHFGDGIIISKYMLKNVTIDTIQKVHKSQYLLCHAGDTKEQN